MCDAQLIKKYTLAPKRTVSSFAADVIGPRVRDMDTASAMDPTVISALFEHGLMGVEAPEDLGGELLQQKTKRQYVRTSRPLNIKKIRLYKKW